MKLAARISAFTLIEMLVVIAIIGILAAIALPTLQNFRKSDAMVAGTRQLLDDVERARQLAISRRTTVYMVFCPSNFWNNPTFNGLANPAYAILPPSEKDKAQRLWDKQLEAYTFVTLRSVGDQPGQISPRYLSPWRSLPDGVVIPAFKFNLPNVIVQISDPPLPVLPAQRIFKVAGFRFTYDVPFPSELAPRSGNLTMPFVPLPYIAFNHLGQLESQVDEYIPLARGSVNPVRDANKNPQQAPSTIFESPPGNSTNAFMLIHIDWLTGRARLEKQEVQ